MSNRTANDLTERERCDRECWPTGRGNGWDEEGDVFRCEHGVIRRCLRETGWGYWSTRRHYWTRLTPWLTPIRYRRALAALGQGIEIEED